MTEERRRSQRYPVVAKMTEHQGQAHQVTDLSQQGMFIETADRPYYVGTPLAFTLELDELRTIEAIGTVVRVADGARRGNGIRFDSMPKVYAAQLQGYLATLYAPGYAQV